MINRLIFISHPSVVNFRHRRNNRQGLEFWLDDDPFMFHIPKTGGTSIARALGRPEPGHQTYKNLIKSYPNVEGKNNFFFVWRDPVERIASTYRYVLDLHRKFGSSNLPQVFYSKDINDFVQNHLTKIDIERHYFLRPASVITNGVDKGKLWALNFKYLSESYHGFMESMGVVAPTLPHENKSSKYKYGDVNLTGSSVNIINDLYSDDVYLGSILGDNYFVNFS
jgi:hypothetical protein